MELTKLKRDATLARALAEATAHVTVDNGSCNLDATFFPLDKGQRAEAVAKAFRDAGLSASPTRWIGRGVMVQPPGQGQANKRHAANEALYQSLSRAGWKVLPYHQMD
jgi:hypothetical protein